MDYIGEPTLVGDLELEDVEWNFPKGEPTKSHYVPTSGQSCCRNEDCGAFFSFTTRPHHCRRCGEVFCRLCLQYRRKLNILAQFDPEGVECKVCFGCFHDNRYKTSVTCTTRSLTEHFVHVRQLCRDELSRLSCDLTLEMRKVSIVEPVLWRHEFHMDIAKECRRLVAGFREAVDNTETEPRRTWRELKSLMAANVPDWQKSLYWKLEKEQSNCRQCGGRLGFRKKRKRCRVCGLALCKSCSNKQLLLYYQDDPESEAEHGPKLSVIKVHGSPDVEPEISLMLYVCNECKSEISQRQIQDTVWFVEKPSGPDVLSQIVALDKCFMEIQGSITDETDQLEELSQMSESGDRSQSGTGVLYTFVKHVRLVQHDRNSQTDEHKQAVERLGATFVSFERLFNKLRSLKTHLNTNSGPVPSILRNYTKCKYDFYMTRKLRYLHLKRHIGDA